MKKAAAAALGAGVVLCDYFLGFVVGINISIGYHGWFRLPLIMHFCGWQAP